MQVTPTTRWWAKLAVVLASLGAAKALAARYYIPSVPANMEDVSLFLTTAGIGHEVNDRFGHTGIRVVNREERTDVVFNWGQFSFEDPAFLWKFFRGQLDYSMGVHSTDRDVASYREMDRLLRMEHLNLTSLQKRSLLEKIAWNSAPEHRNFLYQYWYKNCSTIPRDYLNDALKGAIYQRFGHLLAGKVYRDYVRGNLAYTPFVAPQLDIMMNSNIDRPITAWEDMFLPNQLRSWLLTMPAIDDQGKDIPGVMLLSDAAVLNDGTEDFTPYLNDYAIEVALLVLPLLAAGALFLRYFASGRKTRLDWAYRCLGIATLYWGLFGGIMGLTLLINWGFSGHTDGWHNTNLLLFWPIDLLFVPAGWRMMRSGAPLASGWLMRAKPPRFCLLHAVSFLLLCALTAAHVFTQNIWRAASWFGLPLIALLLLLGLFASSYPAGEKAAAGIAS